MDIEKFKEVQEHNHRIMEQVTVLEQKAFGLIADGNCDQLKDIFREIDELQSQYKEYGSD